MSDVIEVDELLFFDTFSHEEINDINLDLVQFPKPVYITQVRIIPLGARVQADFPGGVRLGATNPSKFDIEFFVNDLGLPGASTFEILGHLRYNQNDCIHLDCSQGKIPTDGLVLRGWYSTITLAVYGVLTNAVHETIASPIPPCEPTGSEEILIGDASIVAPIQNEELKDDWQEPIPDEIMPHKANTSDDYDPEDMEYSLSREHYHHHSEGEREQREMRRLCRFSRSTEHSPTLRTRTHSESNEREYIRTREKIPRDWSRSPEYSRRPRRKRSRSDAEEPHNWPRTPPALIDSPSRQDPIDYDVEESHYKLQKSHAYRQSTESPANAINVNVEETSATPNEQFEPILSDDEIIGDDEEDEVQAVKADVAAAAELEKEIIAEALAAPPAIISFNPWEIPLLKYEGDLHVHFGVDIESLQTLFKMFVTQVNCSNVAEWESVDKISFDEREQFVHFGEQLNTQISHLALHHKRCSFVLQEFFKSDNQHRLQTANILQISLNFEIACLQSQPAYKIRHIKVGAKFAELICNNADFFEYLIQETNFDVFEALFKLYNEQYMALSIKLQILKAMYASLDTKVAVHHFLNSKYNGYKLIIEALKTAKLTRTKYALQSIMRKLHLYEALGSINEHCTQLFVLTNYYPEGNKPLAAFHQIEYALEMILDALGDNSLSYQQPRRLLPVSKKFEIVWDPSAQKNLENTLQSYFVQHSLAESILMILINGNEMPVSTLMCTFHVLRLLFQTSIGLNYFVDDAFETTQSIVSVLLNLQDVPTNPVEEVTDEKTKDLEIEKPTEEIEPNNPEVTPEKQVEKEIKVEENVANVQDFGQLVPQNLCPEEMLDHATVMIASYARLEKLGLQLSYKVQTRYHLDSIVFSATSDVYDVIKLADHLHALHSQTCKHVGRQSTCEVIGINNHMQIFMDLIMKEQHLQTQHQIGSPGTKYKSPVLSYAVDIVDCCVRYCENLDYLIEHGTTILELAKNHDSFEPSVSAVLQEMYVFLKPLETVKVSSYDDISPLVEVIARSMDYITTFPGDLIMGLRILRHLTINKSQDRIDGKTSKNGTVELKHRYVALQFYSADGIQILLQILERLCNYFENPGLHSADLVTIQGVHCCQILLPTLQILREILSFAIHCRDVDFKDLGAIDPLMRVYFLLYYYPRISDAMEEVQLAREEIVKAMLAYTQPSEQDEESLHKSLWTQMLREVLDNISKPSVFIPGTQLLAELLPLPLPMPIPLLEDIQKQQKQRLITERKLWSAHLHPLSGQLIKLINTLAHSSFLQLSEMLQRVCMQLADLAPNMTLLIAKNIIDIMHSEWQSNDQPTPQLARLFLFAGRLFSFAPLKSATLSIVSAKLWDVFEAMLNCDDMGAIVHNCHLAIHRILESYFDSSVSMIGRPNPVTLLTVATALPPKDIIPRMIEGILKNLLIIENSGEISDRAVQNLIRLTNYDYTVYQLTQVLKKKCVEIQNWIEKLLSNKNPIIYLQTIEKFIFLLHASTQLIVINDPAMKPNRTLRMTASDLAQIVNYQATKAIENAINKPQLLQRILNFLEQKDIPASERVLCEARQLIAFLTTCEPTTGAATTVATTTIGTTTVEINGEDEPSGSNAISCGTVEPFFPQSEGLVTQYDMRSVFARFPTSAHDRKITFSYWLDPVPIEEMNELDYTTYERIPCDLTELANACLIPDMNLTGDCKRVLHLSACPQSNRERTPAAPCFRTRRVEVEPTTGRPEKKMFITAVRGRGYSRPPPSRGDLFRSRPPNTSRPPSLHVDDFLALETCGAQPTGPTGYNKIPSMLRGSRIGRNRGSRIAAANAFRQKKLLMRTSSPSMWCEGIPSGIYRSSNTESHYSIGDGPHFSGVMPHFSNRSRGRGLRSRPPYMR